MSDYSEIELEARVADARRLEEGKKLAAQIADYLNGRNAREVVLGMAQQHRTLQQAFTGLCVRWLEHCAELKAKGPGYYDLRNQASVELADKLSKTEAWADAKYLPYI